jgi:hypothetical protein
MNIRQTLYSGAAAITFAVLVVGASTPVRAQQNAPVSIGDTDIGGVVTGPNGPEAGVWVIAETADLPTKMVKIVVTDDQGPICRRRITRCGRAATASSTPPRPRAHPAKS